jgi:hypothetical protein
MKSIYLIVNKCLHYLLALQVLNLSFGNLAAKEPIFSQSGAETNQIDSAIEYITEHLLGWDNFIPEKHKAHQDRHFIKLSTCFLYCERLGSAIETICDTRIELNAVFIPGSLSEYDQEINPPPPKTSTIG